MVVCQNQDEPATSCHVIYLNVFRLTYSEIDNAAQQNTACMSERIHQEMSFYAHKFDEKVELMRYG